MASRICSSFTVISRGNPESKSRPRMDVSNRSAKGTALPTWDLDILGYAFAKKKD